MLRALAREIRHAYLRGFRSRARTRAYMFLIVRVRACVCSVYERVAHIARECARPVSGGYYAHTSTRYNLGQFGKHIKRGPNNGI